MTAEVYFQPVGDNQLAEMAIEIRPESVEECVILQSIKNLPFSSVLVQAGQDSKLRLFSVALRPLYELEDAA